MDALEWRTDWPTPLPEGDEVLIRVGACGLNNTDVNTRSGWYSKAVTDATTGGAYEAVGENDPTWAARRSPSPYSGVDAVGEVVACGPDADSGLIGRRVMVDCWSVTERAAEHEPDRLLRLGKGWRLGGIREKLTRRT